MVLPRSSARKPIAALSNQEIVSVRIRNFGTFSQSNIPLNVFLNNDLVFSEILNQTIEPGDTLEYVFNQSLDLSGIGSYTLEVSTNLVGDSDGTNDKRSKIIENKGFFEASISDDQVVCAGTLSTLTAGGGTQYRWSTGADTESIFVRPDVTTEYTVTVTNAVGCEDIKSVTVTVSIPEKPVISFDGPTEICENGSVILVSNISENIQWSTGAISPQIEVTSSGTYWITHFDENGCSINSDAVFVNFSFPLQIRVSGFNPAVCLGESVTLSVPEAVSLIWSTGETTPAISVSPVETTTYSVTATNSAGCAFQDEVEVVVLNSEVPGQVSNMLPPDGTIGLSPPVQFSWSPASNASLYDLYVWEDSTEVPVLPTVSNITNFNYNFYGNLEFGKTYRIGR